MTHLPNKNVGSAGDLISVPGSRYISFPKFGVPHCYARTDGGSDTSAEISHSASHGSQRNRGTVSPAPSSFYHFPPFQESESSSSDLQCSRQDSGSKTGRDWKVWRGVGFHSLSAVEKLEQPRLYTAHVSILLRTYTQYLKLNYSISAAYFKVLNVAFAFTRSSPSA